VERQEGTVVGERVQGCWRGLSRLKAPQKSLKDWTDQKWRTKSGKSSSETGERYLPEKAIKALSADEYAATTRAKRAGKAKDKQFVAQPKTIARKTAKYRRGK
jgi:hypothetical protein